MPLDVMKLKPGRCRYPLDDDRFCRELVTTSQGRPSPYCAAHHRLCHARSDQRPLRLLAFRAEAATPS